MFEELQAAYPVVVRQAVVWGEMDSYRHVNNVVYFRYFENARLEYFRRLDWPDFEAQTGIGPILAATQARFRRALTYPDTIAITARLGWFDAPQTRFLAIDLDCPLPARRGSNGRSRLRYGQLAIHTGSTGTSSPGP
jgi:YbgC/YbaW family acyl-CoA thioester hydrolase